MKMKHIITSVAMLGIIGVGTAYAFPDRAAPKKEGCTVEQLSEADLKAWTRLHEQHIDKVEQIKNILKARKMELNALTYNAKVTPDYLRDLTEEIVNLQGRITKLNNAFFKQSAEQFNLDFNTMQRGGHGQHGQYGQRMDNRAQRNVPPCPIFHCPAQHDAKKMHQGGKNEQKGDRAQRNPHSNLPRNHPPVHSPIKGDAPATDFIPPVTE